VNRLRQPIGSIKSEVASEGFGWLIGGGFAVRQLWCLLLLSPFFLALVLLPETAAKSVIAWFSLSIWMCWLVFNAAVGIYFISKQIDRRFDRQVRPRLSKDYWKR